MTANRCAAYRLRRCGSDALAGGIGLWGPLALAFALSSSLLTGCASLTSFRDASSVVQDCRNKSACDHEIDKVRQTFSGGCIVDFLFGETKVRPGQNVSWTIPAAVPKEVEFVPVGPGGPGGVDIEKLTTPPDFVDPRTEALDGIPNRRFLWTAGPNATKVRHNYTINLQWRIGNGGIAIPCKLDPIITNDDP